MRSHVVPVRSAGATATVTRSPLTLIAPHGPALGKDSRVGLDLDVAAGSAARCVLEPIRTGRCRRNNRGMQVAIRCHPYAPVEADELESWLAREIEQVRATAPEATVRLMRLTQSRPTGASLVGWLVELESVPGDGAADFHLENVLADMRLLGLQPSLLALREAAGRQASEKEAASVR